MREEAAEKLEEFFRAFAGARNPLLLLDYDGTLAPFRVDRFQARPWAGVRELLMRIQKQGRTHMAVVTGRPAAEITPLLGLEKPLEVWGLHGAERLYPDGRRELEEAPVEIRAKLDELRGQLRNDSLGGLFEDKANGVVMHWRGASPGKARRIEQRTRALFESLARMDGLALLEFEAGLELRAGRDKGEAVEAIVEETGTGGPVAFLGDDVTDETAFRAMNRGSAPHLSVLVRSKLRKTSADVWLRPPGEVKGFLEMWISAARS
ncbi:MAG TPA: trehalose-phosphatase [Terracidiphilus sp.]|nr:trehalose-phosphatase [Terracidiphilus sp.]HEV2486086.1 trehalose-phosphatase [Terracidiphilus sp.]